MILNNSLTAVYPSINIALVSKLKSSKLPRNFFDVSV